MPMKIPPQSCQGAMPASLPMIGKSPKEAAARLCGYPVLNVLESSGRAGSQLQQEALNQRALNSKPPLFGSYVACGFPSPAEDYVDRPLDLHEHLVEHPAATFFCRVAGHSMEGHGIYDNDLLVIDRAVEPRHGSVVVAVVNGELTCKCLDMQKRRLVASHPDYPAIPITETLELIIEGVVTYSIRKHHG
jgi:DNA polymerase V